MKVSVNTFRWSLGDCTNNGISGRKDDFILIEEEDIDAILEADLDVDNYLVYTTGPYDTLRAVPLGLFIDEMAWVMFGGNFVYTSDSRFPSDQPIKVFDRVE